MISRVDNEFSIHGRYVIEFLNKKTWRTFFLNIDDKVWICRAQLLALENIIVGFHLSGHSIFFLFYLFVSFFRVNSPPPVVCANILSRGIGFLSRNWNVIKKNRRKPNNQNYRLFI